MGQTPIQGRRYELTSSIPRNERGERTGTGAIFEQTGRGLFRERVSGAVINALLRTGKIIEVPPEGGEQAINLSGASNDTEQSSNTEINQLLRADEQQTTSSLKATRSALEREVAAQEEAAKLQPQDRNEGVKKPAGQKTVEPVHETETIIIRSLDGKHVIGSFTAPKNATRAELNRAAKATGLDYRVSPLLSTMHGFGTQGKGMWLVLKSAFQAISPPEVQQYK